MPQAQTTPSQKTTVPQTGPDLSDRHLKRLGYAQRRDLNTVLRHFSLLCGHSPRLFNWVMGWIAAPLQQPGRKLLTGLYLAGPEGTGKTMTAGMIADLYTPHKRAFVDGGMARSVFKPWLFDARLVVFEEENLPAVMPLVKALLCEQHLIIDRKAQKRVHIPNQVNVIVTCQQWPDADQRRWMLLNHTGLDQYHLERVRKAWDRHGCEAFERWLHKRDLCTFGDYQGLLGAAEDEAVAL